MFRQYLPWLWPWENEEPSEPERLWWTEWNQEWIKFENGLAEREETPREKLLRLAPPFGDLKKLVL